MTEAWEFIVVRRRDGYNTVVTVPKSECPTIEQAYERVEQEFDNRWWMIGMAPAQNTDTKAGDAE